MKCSAATMATRKARLADLMAEGCPSLVDAAYRMKIAEPDAKTAWRAICRDLGSAGTMTRICSDCPSTLGARNRSGRCRPCLARHNATDPAMIARRVAGIHRRFADPVFRAEHIERLRINGANINEAERERRRVHGQSRIPQLRAANAAITPETRAENGRKRSATVLAWCPPEWRDRYRELKIRGRKAADAKRIVLAEIAGAAPPAKWVHQRTRLVWCPPTRRDEYRAFAKTVGAAEARRIIEADLTPFERQLGRVAAGAQLTTKFVPRKTDPAFTIGGVASGML